MEPLQPFNHRSSPYERPNQDWVCGWQKTGQACALGPDGAGRCHSDRECRPANRAGRWECARSEQAGGRCTEGPLPGGMCARPIVPCRPRRSWKAQRRAVARWAAAAMVGVLLVLLGSGAWRGFVEPGPLTSAHARLVECKSCHAAALGSPLGWVAAAFGAAAASPTDGERCVRCHSVGANAFSPHGLPKGELTRLRDIAAAAPSGATMPLMLRLARVAMPPGEGELQCGLCHREHRGAEAAPMTQSNARCQVCHEAAFASLADGHPAFTNYPATRRTRINFDHVAHIGKYFVEKADLGPPKGCTTCHEPDAAGRQMQVNSFDANCASCHLGDIEGAKRSGAKGLAFVQVPGLDLASLRKRGVPIGEWPELAEAKLSPLTDFLLSTDDAYRKVRTRLLKADLTDLPDDEYDADVQALVWSLKALIDGLQGGGGVEFERRLATALAQPLSPDQKRALTGLLPGAVVDDAQREWFPHLADELKRHRAGLATPLTAIRPAPAKKEEEKKPAKAGPTWFDVLSGGGLLGKGDDDAKSATAPAAQPERRTLSPEERMPFGGWYRDDDALRYRPSGHRDALLQGWLDVSRGKPVFDTLAEPKKSPGVCTKCHSVDAVPGGVDRINWSPRRADPKLHPSTVFSHAKHFSMLGDKGCATCHKLDRKADYQAAYAGRDPGKFASNFVNLQRETCIECHTPKVAGDNCTLCHRYHVGEFASALPAAAFEKPPETPAPR